AHRRFASGAFCFPNKLAATNSPASNERVPDSSPLLFSDRPTPPKASTKKRFSRGVRGSTLPVRSIRIDHQNNASRPVAVASSLMVPDEFEMMRFLIFGRVVAEKGIIRLRGLPDATCARARRENRLRYRRQCRIR